MKKDIRWKQRLSNFSAALQTLVEAVSLSETKELSKLEKQGLIQSFEYTHELAWNVIKDYFQHQGNMQITGSQDAAREAFQKGLIFKGEIWMEMIKSRNQTAHTYNEITANQIAEKICSLYVDQFCAFEAKMQSLAENE